MGRFKKGEKVTEESRRPPKKVALCTLPDRLRRWMLKTGERNNWQGLLNLLHSSVCALDSVSKQKAKPLQYL
jgi:hypothetical protein